MGLSVYGGYHGGTGKGRISLGCLYTKVIMGLSVYKGYQGASGTWRLS
jgi:hypothetical protein